MTNLPPPRWRLALVAVVLAVATVAVFAPARHFQFLYLDDNEYVTENPFVRSGLNADSVHWALTAYHSGHWHPLTWLSLMNDVQWFGVDAGEMHAINVLLHALGVAVLFLALHAATGRITRSAFVAALFAVHPLRVESVAWVATRKDVLSGLFVMLMLWAWARYARQRSPRRYVLALLAFAAALLAKPTVAVVPCGLLLLDWWPLRRLPFSPPGADDDDAAPSVVTTGKALVEKLPFFALAAATLVQTWAAQNAAGAVQSSDSLTLPIRAVHALWNYGLYAARTAWPFDLAVFYPLASVGIDKAVAVGVLLLLATAAAWRRRSRRPWLLFGWLWFCGMLVPVSGIVQFGGQAIADRYSYIPHIGLFVALAWESADRLRASTLPRFASALAAGAVLAACVLLTSAQLGWWTDSVRLLGHAVDVTSGNYLAHNNLGVALEAEGRFDEAAVHYEEAVKLNPTWPEAQNNFGIVLARRGQMKEAIEHFQLALRVRPGFARAHNNLGTALGRLGDGDGAFAEFQKAVELDPYYLDARIALARTLEGRGDNAGAERHFTIAAGQAANPAAFAEDLARVRARLGKS